MGFLFSPEMLDHRLPKTMQVFTLMRDAIIAMRLPPGEVIQEKDIAMQLGLSRTPVREALLSLANQNLIIVRPNQGTLVSPIDIKLVLDGQFLRESLEPRLAKLAARFYRSEYDIEFDEIINRQRFAAANTNTSYFFSLDDEFHKLIAKCANMPEIWLTLHGGTGHLDRVRRMAFAVEQHYDAVIKEHEALYQAIRRGDESSAEELMIINLEVYDSLMILLDKHRHYFEKDDELLSHLASKSGLNRLLG
ncbi:GntR family transcriptional regulator [Pantoea cypripedii]|uniref:GntR family transcriptional regulator n=1 Tax=Pantoea cypripedii TaxID=55209 RepID=A0A6B9G5Q8_PANCY|nr:GntR family transcriptional regulator [Pantoea cypripedii]QGY33061.1 GntR family transcriptional regulator [Pantoea cypripedii]